MAETGQRIVEGRIVRRVIKRLRNISGIGVHVPHDHSVAVEGSRLRGLVSERELGGGDIPGEVVLIAREHAAKPRDVWRRAFHGRVHLAIERKQRQGELSDAAVRERIHRIGQTEFDEIRAVLKEDEQITSSQGDAEVYAEFAAVYLELRHFDPERLRRTFPGLRDHLGIAATLGLDVEASELLEATRPEGEAAFEPMSMEAAEDSEQLIESHAPEDLPPLAPEREALRVAAATARGLGNHARAAIAACRAGLGGEAEGGDLEALVDRLMKALGGGGPDKARWAGALRALVRAAASRPELAFGVEARVLSDLQRACVDHEQVKRTIDVVGWALSFGARKVVRELPVASLVNVARHLRAALQKAAQVRLATADRGALVALLDEAAHRADHELRHAMGPRIRQVLEDVGLRPGSAPERVALRKLVDELLDQVVARGFLGLGHLRDCISRSNLKMPNLSGPGEWWRGDALLQADARLAVELDGVYRRGEIYLRALQKGSSLFFGTRPGRALTLHVLLPSVVAFVALEGVQHLVGPLAKKLFHVQHPPHLLNPYSFAALTVLLYGLIHSQQVRDGTLAVLKAVGRAIKAIFIGFPRWVLALGPVAAVLGSRPALLLWRYLLKPSLVVAPLLGLLDIDGDVSASDLGIGGVVFLALTLALNTGAGLMAQEYAGDWLARTWYTFSHHTLPGVLAYIADLSRWLVEGVDRLLYAVDERLRFRQGDSRGAAALKGAFGVVWFFVTYALRLGINVLFEPQINPIKHFPVVTVSHKLFLPMTPSLASALEALGLSSAKAMSVAVPTIALIPGAVGFLVWELKGNWDLYSQNRSEHLAPVLVGHHGETMAGLLRPGFHSGTVPKLYAKMRKAIRQGKEKAGKYREGLREIEHAVANFLERELLALLDECGAWKSGRVEVTRVEIGSNRIRVGLGCEGHQGAAWIHFEEQSGWIVAHLVQAGWLGRIAPEQRALFEGALTGLYKLASVDLRREQIEALVGGSAYDIADEGLVVWPSADYRTEIVYALDARGPIEPTARGVAPASQPSALDSDALLFKRRSVGWQAWVSCWSQPDAPALAALTDRGGIDAAALARAAGHREG